MGVKHTIELKMPRLFKKRNDDGSIDDSEVTITEREIKKSMNYLVPFAVGIGVGYMIGYKKGVFKDGSNVFIVK